MYEPGEYVFAKPVGEVSKSTPTSLNLHVEPWVETANPMFQAETGRLGRLVLSYGNSHVFFKTDQACRSAASHVAYPAPWPLQRSATHVFQPARR